MRSVELTLAAAVLAVLTGCASAPQAIKKPVEAVQQAIASTASTVSNAAAAVVPEKPIDPEAQRQFDAARAALKAGRAADAERGFKEVAAKYPDLGGAHANLGLIYRNAGKLDESVAALEQAVKVSPRQPVFFNQLGVSYRHKGQFAKAREAYENALALDPNYADAHLNLGVLLDLYLADNQLALLHYERYLALSPGGDAAVGKWVADLKNRKPSSLAQADSKVAAKE